MKKKLRDPLIGVSYTMNTYTAATWNLHVLRTTKPLEDRVQIDNRTLKQLCDRAKDGAIITLHIQNGCLVLSALKVEE